MYYTVRSNGFFQYSAWIKNTTKIYFMLKWKVPKNAIISLKALIRNEINEEGRKISYFYTCCFISEEGRKISYFYTCCFISEEGRKISYFYACCFISEEGRKISYFYTCCFISEEGRIFYYCTCCFISSWMNLRLVTCDGSDGRQAHGHQTHAIYVLSLLGGL